MKIKELRKEMSNIILRMLNDKSSKYVLPMGKCLDQLLNLFTKTMGEVIGEDEFIGIDLNKLNNLWKERLEARVDGRNELRQEMRSKLK